ncbi:hypothetical protein [Curtobacterium sp. 'Ferrero']|uniref:hypothetical protein n=1 Tax=Curtobacterium sp. 'Ferrero' TaxID=2033654 RepID=UPI001141B3EC|nr:hypothetical protein [Curtobacterium sp. 'Ferrero']
MTDTQWSPPHHPDPRRPPIVEMAPDPEARDLDPAPPVWVRIDVEGMGVQRVVGFALKASPLAVYAQLQFLGRTYHLWVERSKVTHRTIPPSGR